MLLKHIYAKASTHQHKRGIVQTHHPTTTTTPTPTIKRNGISAAGLSMCVYGSVITRISGAGLTCLVTRDRAEIAARVRRKGFDAGTVRLASGPK